MKKIVALPRLNARVLSLLVSGSVLSAYTSANAAEIGVFGLFPGKAVLTVDGNPPKIFAVGSNIAPDTRLIAADNETATIEVKGKRQVLAIGQFVHRSATPASTHTVLTADARGHFTAKGQINGGSSLDMLVDTGASVVLIPAIEADRIGIKYKQGTIGQANTANGIVNVYNIRLDSLKVGNVELKQVDASILDGKLPFALLGMSFLKRLEMHREGEKMTLSKHF